MISFLFFLAVCLCFSVSIVGMFILARLKEREKLKLFKCDNCGGPISGDLARVCLDIDIPFWIDENNLGHQMLDLCPKCLAEYVHLQPNPRPEKEEDYEGIFHFYNHPLAVKETEDKEDGTD